MDRFPQMVWDESLYVGCGVARKISGSSYKTYTACHYYPPGNYIGQFANRVQPYVDNPFIPTSFVDLEIENGTYDVTYIHRLGFAIAEFGIESS